MWSAPDTYAIARIDLPRAGTHGWQVRLQRRGVKYGKFFADGVHGGLTEAYEAARSWRDAVIARITAEENLTRICRRSPRNSSGVVGVSKVCVIAANGASYWFWQATWCPAPGARRCVKFSVKRCLARSRSVAASFAVSSGGAVSCRAFSCGFMRVRGGQGEKESERGGGGGRRGGGRVPA